MQRNLPRLDHMRVSVSSTIIDQIKHCVLQASRSAHILGLLERAANDGWLGALGRPNVPRKNIVNTSNPNHIMSPYYIRKNSLEYVALWKLGRRHSCVDKSPFHSTP